MLSIQSNTDDLQQKRLKCCLCTNHQAHFCKQSWRFLAVHKNYTYHFHHREHTGGSKSHNPCRASIPRLATWHGWVLSTVKQEAREALWRMKRAVFLDTRKAVHFWWSEYITSLCHSVNPSSHLYRLFSMCLQDPTTHPGGGGARL